MFNFFHFVVICGIDFYNLNSTLSINLISVLSYIPTRDSQDISMLA